MTLIYLLLFNHSVVPDSLQPRGLQPARLPCPSLSLAVCSNSCSLSWWCHLTISSSVTSFSSCPQSFLASGSFPMSQIFASDGQSISLINIGLNPDFPFYCVLFWHLIAPLSSIINHRAVDTEIVALNNV